MKEIGYVGKTWQFISQIRCIQRRHVDSINGFRRDGILKHK